MTNTSRRGFFALLGGAAVLAKAPPPAPAPVRAVPSFKPSYDPDDCSLGRGSQMIITRVVPPGEIWWVETKGWPRVAPRQMMR